MSTPEYLEPLGQVTANFSDLEADLSFMVWSLIGTNKQIGQIITSQLSFASLVRVLRLLFEEKCEDKKLRAELKKLLKEADSIRVRRNTFIHSVWFTDPKTLRVRRAKVLRSQGEVETEDIDVKEMTKFGNRIGSFILALNRFRVKAKL